MQRARTAEAEAAAATVVLLQCGVRLERQLAAVAHANLVVGLPVAGTDAIHCPVADHARRLGADAADGVADVVDGVEHLLGGVDGTVDANGIGAPDVSDFAAWGKNV